MEAAPDWLEDDHDIDHDTKALDEDAPKEFYAESRSVPLLEPQSQSEGHRPGGSTSSGRGLD